ncbi:hypothetical protein [Spiroplasma endosymbiont of Megaselia nigra]|uniref:hypothetical protein n=1 Tax=Spiroplasma endosymbiont of Megaselia nigra TaxID=2478537 RepID=UPI000F87589C|nr:hypothetical protein [Spiroplasma endosymbiont of Megaselia nigra]RUO85935.1 hypothetical protein D9R21_05965 [Spiroplasma endosymbiont of Megaselia nigra]
MKKLLSLLSVLTISGSAVPTTIAASPYQKEEIKLENSNINYSEISNLNLNRNKRSLDTLDLNINFGSSTGDEAVYTFSKNTWIAIGRAFGDYVRRHDKNFAKYLIDNVFKNSNLTNVSWKFNGLFGIGYSGEFYKLVDTISAKYYDINRFISNNYDYNWFCLIVPGHDDKFYVSNLNLPSDIGGVLDDVKKIALTGGCAAVGSLGGPAGAAASAIACYYIN